MGDGAVERAISAIRDRLLTGQLVAGQRLIEQDLVEMTGIGRSSIREALQRLASEGVIELVRNRGAVVRSLSRKEAHDILDIRENLEGMAAEAAARNIDRGDNRAKLERAIDDMIALGDTRDAFLYNRANLNFHRVIVEISGNARLAAILEQLHTQIFFGQFRQTISTDQIHGSIAQHREIATAIFEGDGKGARRAMTNHVQRSRAMISALPDSVFRLAR